MEPTFLLEIAIEPRGAEDRERLPEALERLKASHAFASSVDPHSGQTILRGPDEIALDLLFDGLKAEGIDLHIGAPQVAYRETITAAARVDYVHKRITGPTAEFGRLVIELAPSDQDGVITVAADAGALPAALREGAIRGIESMFAAGILAGFPVVGVAATIGDAAYHEIDSTPEIFAVIARAATREALQKGRPNLLEPWMRIEATGPDLDRLARDLAARGATIASITDAVRGFVRLASMFGYANSFRAMTQGHGTWSMVFDGYRPVPRGIGDDDGPFAPAAAMRA